MRKSDSYASIFDPITNAAEKAANLHTRSELLQKISEIVHESGWEEADAARHCGISQPRMDDLLRGRVSHFSLDALVNIATALGLRVHVELGPA
ncbi:helix-turn-helix domain protein [Collimonas fungivorans]|uniref:Helix-turn-helix domain protein n=1 Tax=Collimonas fungivorans TaxID=158899 RepID=A0A127PFG4_9BURK|nr:helix-turn-helix transcriptional regulator [Collimonas fungivorans]AMO96487.1 helix-turn-helix domain protein [Collimonas fungivorans]